MGTERGCSWRYAFCLIKGVNLRVGKIQRLLAAPEEADIRVVLQMQANTGRVADHGQAQALQVRGLAHAREHQ